MRLTVDVVGAAPARMNPAFERELDLRGAVPLLGDMQERSVIPQAMIVAGLKAPAVENLGVAGDAFDALDLSENELVRLDHFPIMRRLSSLYVSNNLISRISSSIASSLPSLHTLILTNNRINVLMEIEALIPLRDLRFLSLMHNPVTRKQHYRYFVIYTLPQVRILDFNKITKKERVAAAKFFLSKLGKVFLQELGAHRPAPSVAAVEDTTIRAPSVSFSPGELLAIKAAISAATSSKEIDKLESALRDGKLPTDRL